MSQPATAAIIGLGLMGGSLARELAARGVEVLAYDPDPDALRAAEEEGVVRRALPASLEGVAQATLLVVAAPVTAAPRVLETALPHLRPECVVTDLGSTKRSIGAAAERLGIAERFVGSHPLTGDHRSGWRASRAGLFHGARVFLCPTPRTRSEVLERVRGFWVELGARPETLPAAEHDRQLAWTSHLPQLAATALALALDGNRLSRSDLGPGGRDMTRLAASSPEMWAAICADNADLLEGAIAGMEERLSELRAALRASDRETLVALLERARGWTHPDPHGG